MQDDAVKCMIPGMYLGMPMSSVPTSYLKLISNFKINKTTTIEYKKAISELDNRHRFLFDNLFSEFTDKNS